MNATTSRIAIYPGTFDPITFGHIDILTRAANLFDYIILAVARSSSKTTIFSSDERVKIATQEIQSHSINNVKVIQFDGLLVEFAKQQNVKVIIRGLRALSDFEYEFQMAYVNRKLFEDLETIFLPATEKGHFISSTFVKEVARLGGDLSGLVSKEVAAELVKKF